MWDLSWPHLVCRFKSNLPIVLIDTVPLQTLHFNIDNVQNVTLAPPYQHRQVQKCTESGPYCSSENLRNVNSNMLSLILHLHQRPRYLEAQPNPTQPIHGDFLANLCWRIVNEEQSLMLPFKQALPTIMITYSGFINLCVLFLDAQSAPNKGSNGAQNKTYAHNVCPKW
jgi:hypothetical protein